MSFKIAIHNQKDGGDVTTIETDGFILVNHVDGTFPSALVRNLTDVEVTVALMALFSMIVHSSDNGTLVLATALLHAPEMPKPRMKEISRSKGADDA